MEKKDIFICECNSLEHQYVFWYDEDENELYCQPHLNTYRNIWGRLWQAFKYVLGYKSRFGDWDAFIFKQEDLHRLNQIINKKYKNNE